MKREFYDNEHELDVSEQKRLHKREKMLVTWRTVLFVGTVGSIGLGWDSGVNYFYILAAILGMIYIRLVNYHDDLKARKEFLKSRLNVLSTYIRRAKGTWRKRKDDGSEYLKRGRAQDVDLHIFGAGSVYQYIRAARTKRGRDLLADAFKVEVPDFNEVRSRQRGVAELLQRPRLTLDIEAYARLMPNGHDTSELIESVEEELEPLGKVYKLRIILPLILIATIILASIGLVTEYAIITAVIIMLAISFVAIPGVNERLSGLNLIGTELGQYRAIFERLEGTNFNSNRLSAVQAILTDEVRASEELKWLGLLSEGNNWRRNPLFFIIGNGLIMSDMWLVSGYMKWRRRVAGHLRTWLDAYSELEVLMSLATIGQTREIYCFPTFYEGEEPRLKAEGLTSLLVAEDKGVANDVELEAGTTIITGANMSGKTTWIRTLAGAVMLAYSGAPVCAKNFVVSGLKVQTSIRVNDDLSAGVSTFYAELLRLKGMIESVEHGEPMLACIDEIFKGTNVNDRIIGAKEAIRRLTTEKSIVLVTTHDFELCELEQENNRIKNAHFEEHYVGEEIKFDYKLREGRTHTTNAKYLLRLAGINIE